MFKYLKTVTPNIGMLVCMIIKNIVVFLISKILSKEKKKYCDHSLVKLQTPTLYGFDSSRRRCQTLYLNLTVWVDGYMNGCNIEMRRNISPGLHQQ